MLPRLWLAAAALSGWLLSPSALRAEPSVSIVPLGFAASEFRAPSSRVAALVGTTDSLRANKAIAGTPLVVVWGKDGGAALGLRGDEIAVLPLGGAGDIAALERGRDAIAGSRLQAAGPLSVALTEPTRDYAHGALGSAVHAGAVTIVERRPVEPWPDPKPVPTAVSRVQAGPGAVFEDRAPRLADLDGDGVPEIVTVRSYLDRGSALAVIGRQDGTWRIVAETPPTGEPNRWLNPAAIADFDGSGRPGIAVVATPHVDGVLQVWAYDGGKLVLRHSQAGYSNHAFGERAQDLAALVDVDGDGVPELAIPTLDRRSLSVLSLKNGIVERARIALPAAVLTGVAVLGQGRGTHILVGLDDGRIADIRP